MEQVELRRSAGIRGKITPPPDKSISHRAVMFAALARGTSRIRDFLRAEDPVSTMQAFRMLGVEIEEKEDVSLGPTGEIIVYGKGLYGLSEPFDVIDCGNSGTTIRLISGILSGNPFFSVLTGDDSLKQRPMARVINPLRDMGADISGRGGDRYPPVAIRGRRLRPTDHVLPVASAQVKSCLLLAGLYADGEVAVTEPFLSRDHTERMLKAMGADLTSEGTTVRVRGGAELNPCDVAVPADFSSAAFLMVAGLILPGSEILIQGVGINPTRTGLLDVIREMGGVVETVNECEVSGEPVADLLCRTAGGLRPLRIGPDRIPSLIDEFPVLCVLAAFADGLTEIRGAGELRVKESDRIAAMSAELRKLGVELEEYPDGIAIMGKGRLHGAVVDSHGDHRIAMALAVAALAADGTTLLRNPSCVDISFPGFFKMLGSLAV